MGKVIQEIVIKDYKLFIVGFDKETDTLEFRTSFEPKFLQKEVITLKNNFIYTNLYNFHIHYLQSFIQKNRK